MRVNIKNSIIMAVCIALLQLGIIGGMLAKGLHPLWLGKTVKFQTRPLDPRDLLRGQYVRLGYDFSGIRLKSVDHDLEPGRRLRKGDEVYVGLSKKDGRWRAVEVRRDLPDVKSRSKHRVYLKGTAEHDFHYDKQGYDYVIRIAYGLERFYTDPDRALELEKISRRKPVRVVTAVTDAGIARIRDLKIIEEKR